MLNVPSDNDWELTPLQERLLSRRRRDYEHNSRHTIPVMQSDQQGLDKTNHKRGTRESLGVHYELTEKRPSAHQAGDIYNPASYRASGQLRGSYDRRAERLTIGLDRRRTNWSIVGIFVVLVLIMVWFHQSSPITHSRVFQKLEQSAHTNNGSVKFDSFRHEMFFEQGVSETDWAHFLDEVQQDRRLIYEKDDNGEGVIRFDV